MALDRDRLREGLLRHAALGPALRGSAVYLIGSHARGDADAASDVDVLVLAAGDQLPAGACEQHVARVGTVELCVFGPAGRDRREREEPVVWHSELEDAVVLWEGWPGAEAYREQRRAWFAAERPRLVSEQHAAYRRSRAQAATALVRGDPLASAIVCAQAARRALRVFLLARGVPYPSDKWLAARSRRHGGEALCAAAEGVVDAVRPAAERRQALAELDAQLAIACAP